ncbi:MAG: MarR family transcriptional regulator [Alphaproteobacteria bacterium]|nr:MarR family transcriptional regulator [Alphaproteobacteria bacterium]
MSSQTDAARRSDDAVAPTIDFRLSESPAHLLRRAQQYASEIFAKAGLSEGVTLRQTVLLAAIAELEGRSQSELVRATGVDRSTLADMIARMEKKGLVSRSAAAEDGRAKSVSLTLPGRLKLAEALPAMQSVDAALIAVLPRNKQQSFRDTLGFLSSAADDIDIGDLDEKKRLKKAAKAEKAAKSKKKKRKKKKK